MPFLSMSETPLAPGAEPVSIFYREAGTGPPLLFLHGGWGYEIYPFDKQIEAFSERFRILIPDRTGYGRSMRVEELTADFHDRAAGEMLRFLDGLGIKEAALWGHSDGAVIAAKMALEAPDRILGIILEAFHFYRMKPGSREFFETMSRDPDLLGQRVASALSRDHGEDYWRRLIEINGRAWLEIAEGSRHAGEDLYSGRLREITVPTLFIHGSRDPRTEPGEIEAVRRELPRAHFRVIEGGAHSPHSESAAAAESNQAADEFLQDMTYRLA